MPISKQRLRPPPAKRFAGSELCIDLESALAALRREPHGGKDKHRQITLFRRGSLRLVLFSFEAGGRLPGHRAPGFVVIHALRGTVRVQTPKQSYELSAGRTLVLEPKVVHELEALEEADVLLTVSLVG